MKRRAFIITTSLASANPYFFDWLTGDYKSRQENNISFLVEKSSQGMLFPRPPDGHSLNISPPGFCWYPAPGASDYIIRISDVTGKILYEKRTGPGPVQMLEISQSDKFDTPYNTGIPEEFHKAIKNHWHVTVETKKKALKSRIEAIMVVDTLKDSIEIDLLRTKGWFGAKVEGSFGQVEGWIQFEPGSAIPEAYCTDQGATKAMLCAKDINDELIYF